MKKGFAIILACAIILAALLAGVARADEMSRQETPLFSNKDLEKYKNSSDGSAVTVRGRMVEKSDKAQRETQREEMYWCRNARKYRRQIDRAKDDVQEIERRSSGENVGLAFSEIRLKKATRRKYEQAKKKLKEAERELQYVEEDARRKDIPPGWLRCQFE